MKGEIEIINHQRALSDKEIEAFKDFDKLLKLHSAAPSQPGLKGKMASGASFLVLAITSVVLVYLWGGRFTTQPAGVEVSGVTVPAPQEPPVVTVPETSATPSEPAMQNLKPRKETVQSSHQREVEKGPPAESSIPIGKYQPAVPIDGYDLLYEYFYRELQYPQEMMEEAVSGTIEVQFSITRTGEIRDVKLLNSLSPKLDAEAIRVVQQMPPWTPATINQTPVHSKLAIPLTFGIIKNEEK